MVKLPGDAGLDDGWGAKVVRAEDEQSERDRLGGGVKPDFVSGDTEMLPKLKSGPTEVERPPVSAIPPPPAPEPVAAPAMPVAPAAPQMSELEAELRRLGGIQDSAPKTAPSDAPPEMAKSFGDLVDDAYTAEIASKVKNEADAKAYAASPKSWLDGTVKAPPELKSDPDLLRKEADRGRARQERWGGHPSAKPSGVYMTNDDQKEWGANQVKWKEYDLKHLDRMVTQAQSEVDDWMRQHPGQDVPASKRERLRKVIEFRLENREKVQKELQEARDVAAGKKPGPDLTTYENTIRAAPQAAVSTAAAAIRGAAIGAGFLGKSLGADIDPLNNQATRIGDAADAWGREMFPTDDKRAKEFATIAASALGSAAVFYGGAGGTAAVLKAFSTMSRGQRMLWTAASTSLLGATAGGDEGAQDALRSLKAGRNVTYRDVLYAYSMTSMGGATEILPIFSWLKAKRGGWLVSIAEQSLEEGSQEAFQTFWQNLAAKILHDPNRDLSQGITEAFVGGAFAGGVMQGARMAVSPDARAAENAARQPDATEAGPVPPLAQIPPTPDEPPETGTQGPVAAATPSPAPAQPVQAQSQPAAPQQAPARDSTAVGGESVAARPVENRAATAADTEVVTPDGSMTVPVETVVVELDDLKFASGDLQPRDRSRAESEVGVRERAANLDPQRLMPQRVSDGGAPIITRDGTIISGNGRVMSIEQVYGSPGFSGNADAYRQAIGAAGEGMSRPVMVRRIASDLPAPDLRKFADLSNRSSIAQMSATERAQRDAQAAQSDVMQLYQGGSFEAPQNREFLRAFVERAVTQSERGSMAKDGRLTKEGEDRLNAAVLAASYGDPDMLSRMLESTDDNIKSISGAMRDVSGLMMQLKASIEAGETDPQFDISGQVVDAARRIADMRQAGIKPVDALAQQDAFTQMDPITEAIIRGFYNEQLTRPVSRQKMTALLGAYIQEAKGHTKEGLIPDETTAADVIELARSKARGDGDADLFADGTGVAGGIDAGTGSPDGRSAPDDRGQEAGTPDQDVNINTDTFAASFIRNEPEAPVDQDQINFFNDLFGDPAPAGPVGGPTDAMREAFSQVLAGPAPRKNWGNEVDALIDGDVTSSQLADLEREAIDQGLLTETKAGKIRRAQAAKTKALKPQGSAPAIFEEAGGQTSLAAPATTSELIGAEAIRRRAPSANQQDAGGLFSDGVNQTDLMDFVAPSVIPQIVAADLADVNFASQRAEAAIEAFEAENPALDVPPLLSDDIIRIETARVSPEETQAVLDELAADPGFRKNDALRLADISGYPTNSRTTKKQALDSIVQRTRDMIANREIAELIVERTDDLRADAEGISGSTAPGDVSGIVEAGQAGSALQGDREGSDRAQGGLGDRSVDGTAQGRPADDAAAQGADGRLSDDPGAGERDRIDRDRVRALVADKEQERQDRRAKNYQITAEDQIGQGTEKQKVRANIDAIKVLRVLENERRAATADEKRALSRYVGWGAFAQALFDDRSEGNAKKWAKERAELKDIVSPEEYASARESTLNAHFTSPEVVDGMWSAMRHLGFDGGRALEPAAGSGNFIGMMPSDLAASTDWVGVELDELTGNIAKHLYGGSDIRVAGFETQNWPDNFFDVSISNVPFGQYKLRDTSNPDYKGLLIHDYFIVKGLDKVRPGGLVAYVTSSGTMDKQDSRARKLMAKRADLVGAIRLPGGNKGAFASNAGTEVTTDILFFQKRGAGQSAADTAWTETVEHKTPDGVTKINRYFSDNPKMMLGKMRLAGTMYRKDSPVLIGPTDNMGDRIASAAKEFMPEGVYVRRGESVVDQVVDDVDADASAVKEGAFYEKDGKIYRRVAGVGQSVKASAVNARKIQAFMEIRDVYNKLLGDQSRGIKESGDSLRADLHRTYDAFVKKFGPINKTTVSVTKRVDSRGNNVVIRKMPNFEPFRSDPDAFKVSALEAYDENSGKAAKAAVFDGDVLVDYTRPAIQSESDALAISLNERGKVDIPFLAKTLQVSEEEAVAALGDMVFLNPSSNEYETGAVYLSGDVVGKLEDARRAAETDGQFSRHVEALDAVQPPPLTRVDIRVLMGAPWIDTKYYTQFLEDVVGGRNVELTFLPASKRWEMASGYFPADIKNKWGHGRAEFQKIVEAALNNKSITVKDKSSDGAGGTTEITNNEATEEVQARIDQLRAEFGGNAELGIDGWVWSDEARARELEAIYNNRFNRLVSRTYDGKHLTFPGMAQVISFPDGGKGEIHLPEYRTGVIWRIISEGNTLMAHGVGSGKTFTSIMSGMEQKRLGLIQRPAYVVPNHMLEQFTREFLQIYPNAKLLVADKDSMSKDKRKEFAARTAAERWDGVIITHDAFGRVSMSPDFVGDFLQSEIDAMVEMESQAKAEGDGRDPSVKDIERKRKSLEERLAKLSNEERKDDGITFEEMGIDFLYVDEAHLFKNLNFNTKQGGIKGLSQRPSQRAYDLFMKIQYLEKSRPGRSAVFMTGTPVSNSIAELYTMMRYLQLPVMREYGIEQFDEWLQTFAEVTSQPEIAPNGRDIRDTRSISKFVNLPELMNIYGMVADVQTPAMLKLPTPELEGGTPIIVESELSDAEERIMTDIVRRSEEVKGKKPEKGEDNILSVMMDGLKLATDVRLLQPDQPVNPDNKIGKAIDNVVKEYEQGGTPPAMAQIVFLDMGVPQSVAKASALNVEDGEGDGDIEMMRGNFDLYNDIKARLIERGIPKEEIAFIHDANNDIKKARLFKAVKEGRVRILLGTTGKMGVGTNVQQNLVAMHHIDAPWRPADLEQRDGRIMRQGNKNKSVRIYRYITTRSLDAVRWQQLERKAGFIAQLAAGARGLREAEDIDSPLPEASQIKAAATGDPRIMEHAELSKEVRVVEAQKRTAERSVTAARKQVESMTAEQQKLAEAVAAFAKDAALVTDVSGDNFEVSVDVGTSGPKTLKERKKAGEAIKTYIVSYAQGRGMYGGRTQLEVGTLSGLTMKVEVERRSVKGEIVAEGAAILKGEKTYFGRPFTIDEDVNPVSLMQRFEYLLGQIPLALEQRQERLAVIQDQVPKLIEQSQFKEFAREAELRQMKARLKELEIALDPAKQQKAAEAAIAGKLAQSDAVAVFTSTVESLKAKPDIDAAITSAIEDADVLERSPMGADGVLSAVAMAEGVSADGMNAGDAQAFLTGIADLKRNIEERLAAGYELQEADELTDQVFSFEDLGPALESLEAAVARLEDVETAAESALEAANVPQNLPPISQAAGPAEAAEEARLWREQLRRLDAGQPLILPQPIVNAVLKEVAANQAVVKPETRSGALASVRRLAESEIDPKARSVKYEATYKTVDGGTVSVRLTRSILGGARAIYHWDADAILLNRIFVSSKIGAEVAGEIRHESLHAIWPFLPAGVRERLVSHADLLGVLKMQLGTVLRAIGQAPRAQTAELNKPIGDIYSERVGADSLPGEAAAHLVELAHHGHFSTEELAPIQDVLDMLESGDFAGLVQEAESGVESIAAAINQDREPVTPGLDMSQAARLQRAREMGFDTDTVYYHGTNAEFDAFDLSYFGKTDWGFRGKGVYMTPEKEVARRYGQSVGEYHVKGPIAEDGNARADGIRKDSWASAMSEAKVRGLSDYDRTDFVQEFVNNRLAGEGYTGRFDGDELIIFDPSNIRSVNAAFDPAHDGSPNLMFALGGVSRDTVLYRGEPANAEGGLGHHYTRSFDRAKGFAGEGGKVYAVLVPLERMGELKPSRDANNFIVPSDLRGERVEVRSPQDMGMMFALGGPGMDRAPLMDELGFVSRAVEAARGLKQAKGTPEQMLSQLRKAGVKQAEIDATELEDFLEGQKSVTRDGLVAFLELQRVPVREAVYGAPDLRYAAFSKEMEDKYGSNWWGALNADEQAALTRFAGNEREPKWSEYSLDPSNPTYRETVLHLPDAVSGNAEWQTISRRIADNVMSQTQLHMTTGVADVGQKLATLQGEYNKLTDRRNALEETLQSNNFRSGHFSEPNAISHLRTSIQPDAEGRQNFVINELQSDWGQKLRDSGGARDEAKIAELKEKLRELSKKDVDASEWWKPWAHLGNFERLNNPDFQAARVAAEPVIQASDGLREQKRLLEAELHTAETAAPGNPLVNTTDQWVATSLRRALRQAVDADADYIAIASGETVYGFGMGAPLKGLTYAYNEMYPKKLRDILKKIDKDAAKPETVERLMASDGESPLGQGFARFPITQKIKDSVRERGLPLFAIRPQEMRAPASSPWTDAPVSQKFAAAAPEFAASLKSYAEQMLPRDVAVRVVDQLEYFGQELDAEFSPSRRAVTIAMDSGPDRVFEVARHEAVHVARIMGLFSANEWQILTERAAKVNPVDAESRAYYMDTYRGHAESLGLEGADVDAFAAEYMDQEAVARLAEPGASYGRTIDGLMQRVRDFLEAVVNAARGLGFQSARDIFNKLETGEVANRAKPVAETVAGQSALSVFDLADTPADNVREWGAEEFSGTVEMRRDENGNRIRVYKTEQWGSASVYENEGTGTWSMQMFNAPNEEAAAELASEIENDLGQYLSPDGWLLPEQYERWLNLEPHNVKGRRQAGALFHGLYAPPSHVGLGAGTLGEVVVRADDAGLRSKAARMMQELRSLQSEMAPSVLASRRMPGQYDLGSKGMGSDSTDAASVKLEDLVKDFKRMVTSGPETIGGAANMVRQGRLDPGMKRRASNRGGWLAGLYNRDTGVTRMAIPRDFKTLTHEGGHALETRADTRDAIEALKQAHAYDLIVPPAPDYVPQPFPTAGFTGMELDAPSLEALVQLYDAEMQLKGGRLDPRQRSIVQEQADLARAILERNVGPTPARAALADLMSRGLPVDQATVVATERFTASGQPQPRSVPGFSADQISEAWSNWFQQYLTSPDLARRQAPELFEEFGDSIDGIRPEMLQTLENIQEGYQELVNASPVAALRSRLGTSLRKGVWATLRQRQAERGLYGGLKASIGDWQYYLYRDYLDNKHPLKVAVRYLADLAVANNRVQLNGNERAMLKAIQDPYKRARMAEHVMAHATAVLQDGVRLQGATLGSGASYQDALTTAFGGSGALQWSKDNIEKFGTFLIARRLEAEWKRFEREELPNPPDQLISRPAINKAMADLLAENPQFAKAATQLDEFQKNVLTWQFEQGFLTQEAYDDYMSRDGYAPLNRVMDQAGAASALKSASGRNKGKMIQRFLGSTLDFINPLESIAQNVYQVQSRVELNAVIRTLDKLAREAGPGGGAIAERIPANDMRATKFNLRDALKLAAKAQGLDDASFGNLMNEIDVLFDEDAAVQMFKATETNERGEQIMWLWENGKKVPVLIGETEIARDIFQMFEAIGKDNTDAVFQAGVFTAQFLRAGVTKSPAYIMTNLLRDQLATWILSDSYTPFVTAARGSASISVPATIGLPAAMAGAAAGAMVGAPVLAGAAALGVGVLAGRALTGSKVINKEALAEASKRYNFFAGLMGGIDASLMSTSTQKREIEALRKDGFWAVPGGTVIGRSWNGLMRTMEITEAATRVGHMDAARRRALADGMTEEEAAFEAAYIAHDVMDFSRRGRNMSGLARLIPFLNAAMQGLDAMRRTVITGERNKARTKQDAQGKAETYRELATPYIKAMEGHSLSIVERERLPLSAKAVVKMMSIGAIGLALAAYYDDDEEYEEFSDYMRATHWFFKVNDTWYRFPKPFELAFFSNLFEAAYAGFKKEDPRAAVQFAESLQHTLIPPHEIQAAKLFYEMRTGTNLFTGRDIVPMGLEDKSPRQQFTSYTSELGKLIGGTFNLSPVMVDHFVGGMFATVGRDTMTVSNSVLPWVNQQTGGALPGVRMTPAAERSFEDYVFWSRFTRRSSRGALSTEYFSDQMRRNGGKFVSAASDYEGEYNAGQIDGAVGSQRRRQAKAILDGLDDDRKAFALLQVNDFFGADERRLHPLKRAKDISSVAYGILREMNQDGLIKQNTTTVVPISPADQRKVNEILSDVAMREKRNALIVTGITGWKQKKITPVDGLLEELKSVSPDTHAEYEARQRNKSGKRKILKFEDVQRLWPQAQKAILDKGREAAPDVKSLFFQAELY